MLERGKTGKDAISRIQIITALNDPVTKTFL